MKIALLTSLLVLAGSAPAFAALSCSFQSRSFSHRLSVQSLGEDKIAGYFTDGFRDLNFTGTQSKILNNTVTYALEGDGLTSLEVTETFVANPEPAPCPRCASPGTFKTTAKLLGAGVAQTFFTKCSGSID